MFYLPRSAVVAGAISAPSVVAGLIPALTRAPRGSQAIRRL
jgi:hypothetical protein